MGEQLAGQLRRAGDRHRGRRWQVIEQPADLLQLQPHAAVDPGRLHQLVVLGRQVDRVDHPALLVQQPAGAGQEDDLVGLQQPHQRVGGEVGVDVDDLPAGGLAEAGDHRDRACRERRADRGALDAGDLAHQAEPDRIDHPRLEHARDDRSGAGVMPLQRLHQPQVLGMEYLANHGQRPWRGDAQAVDGLLLDAGRGQLFVELGPGTMHHDRGQADVLEEGQRGRERVEVVAQHGPADLDDGEARGIELREALEVLAHLARARHGGEQPDDGLARLQVVPGGGNGHSSAPTRQG